MRKGRLNGLFSETSDHSVEDVLPVFYHRLFMSVQKQTHESNLVFPQWILRQERDLLQASSQLPLGYLLWFLQVIAARTRSGTSAEQLLHHAEPSRHYQARRSSNSQLPLRALFGRPQKDGRLRRGAD